MYKGNPNDLEEEEMSSLDLIDGINEVMRNVREEAMEREAPRGEGEIYFLETRKELYPLQLIGRLRQ